MNQDRQTSAGRRVAVFDLDGTLTWRDTLAPFLAGYLRNRSASPRRAPPRWAPLRWAPLRMAALLPRLVAALGVYAVEHDRGELKSQVIRLAMGGDPRDCIDAWAREFVAGMAGRRLFRPAALAVVEGHRHAGDHLVLLSASPDLYVPHVASLLRFDFCLCTEMNWRDGRLLGTLKTPNRHGQEKVSCLADVRGRYPGLPITAYGNSQSDLPHLRLADSALLVNGNGAARRAAATLGIETANWS